MVGFCTVKNQQYCTAPYCQCEMNLNMLIIICILQKVMTEFYTRWEKAVSGVIKHGQEVPKNSFAMNLCCLVEAEGCAGYIADVRREWHLKEG